VPSCNGLSKKENAEQHPRRARAKQTCGTVTQSRLRQMVLSAGPAPKRADRSLHAVGAAHRRARQRPGAPFQRKRKRMASPQRAQQGQWIGASPWAGTASGSAGSARLPPPGAGPLGRSGRSRLKGVGNHAGCEAGGWGLLKCMGHPSRQRRPRPCQAPQGRSASLRRVARAQLWKGRSVVPIIGLISGHCWPSGWWLGQVSHRQAWRPASRVLCCGRALLAWGKPGQ